MLLYHGSNTDINGAEKVRTRERVTGCLAAAGQQWRSVLW